MLIRESHDSMDAPVAVAKPSAMLAAFIATNPAARRVGSALKVGAEAAIRFVDEPGDWRLHVPEQGKATLENAAAADADFELYLPTAAVAAITGRTDGDVGDLGIIFFEHILAKDPSRQVGVKVLSGVVKLTRRGWFGVLAMGGPKVVMWMTGKGLRGPGAVASALSRLKG